MCGSVNLVVVVVEAGNVGAGELGDLAGRAANATANIEDFHALLDANAVRKIMFVTSNGLTERLAMREAAKVE